MAELIVNSKAGCGFCDGVKKFLAVLGIPFTEVVWTDSTKEVLFGSLGLAGKDRTFPQVVVQGPEGAVRIGGFMDTLRTGGQKLREMLAHG